MEKAKKEDAVFQLSEELLRQLESKQQESAQQIRMKRFMSESPDFYQQVLAKYNPQEVQEKMPLAMDYYSQHCNEIKPNPRLSNSTIKSAYQTDSQSTPEQKVSSKSSHNQKKITKQTEKPLEEVKEFENDQQSESVKSFRTLMTSEFQALNENMFRKQMQKPIYFNIIVIGESAIGKTTFVQCFLQTRFQKSKYYKKSEHDLFIPKTLEISEHRGFRVENGMQFNINLIDTPGYTQNQSI